MDQKIRFFIIGDSLENDISQVYFKTLIDLLITSGIHREVNNFLRIVKKTID